MAEFKISMNAVMFEEQHYIWLLGHSYKICPLMRWWWSYQYSRWTKVPKPRSNKQTNWHLSSQIKITLYLKMAESEISTNAVTFEERHYIWLLGRLDGICPLMTWQRSYRYSDLWWNEGKFFCNNPKIRWNVVMSLESRWKSFCTCKYSQVFLLHQLWIVNYYVKN